MVSRKLAAVVFADVAGYSRLMERDEAGTHARLREIREGLLDPKIAEHGGRIVHTSGDGMLLEFPSATAALRCAVEIQREMGVRNLYRAPDERIEFRVGINLGDIIVEGSDIVGDGVNVAQRLETLAEPGGICVASAVWDRCTRTSASSSSIPASSRSRTSPSRSGCFASRWGRGRRRREAWPICCAPSREAARVVAARSCSAACWPQWPSSLSVCGSGRPLPRTPRSLPDRHPVR
jgi:class 3 adenylate cyclase